MFPSSDVCGADRGLCIQSGVDLYHIRDEPHFADIIYFISGVVDNYFFSAYDVLCDGPAEAGTIREGQRGMIMEFKEQCIQALEEKKLFEDSGHKTRFKELMDCYSNYPFFCKGLCKCMYLSAWDEEHFAIMLGILTELALGREKNTEEMRRQGEELAMEHMDGNSYIYQMSNAFLDGRKYELPRDTQIEPEFAYIIRKAQEAAEVIENI